MSVSPVEPGQTPGHPWRLELKEDRPRHIDRHIEYFGDLARATNREAPRAPTAGARELFSGRESSALAALPRRDGELPAPPALIERRAGVGARDPLGLCPLVAERERSMLSRGEVRAVGVPRARIIIPPRTPSVAVPTAQTIGGWSNVGRSADRTTKRSVLPGELTRTDNTPLDLGPMDAGHQVVYGWVGAGPAN